MNRWWTIKRIPAVILIVATSRSLAVTFQVGPGKPYLTIQTAVNAGAALDIPGATNNTPPASPVDIVVFAGSYTENVNIPADTSVKFNGQNDSWTIRANSGDRVLVRGGISIGTDRDHLVFDGINVELSARSGYSFAQTARSSTVKNCFIYGGGSTFGNQAVNFAGISMNRLFGSNFIEHVTIVGNTLGISASDNSTFTLKDSIVAMNDTRGLTQVGGNANTISFSDNFNTSNCSSLGVANDCSSFTNVGGNLNWAVGLDPQFVTLDRNDPQFLWLAESSPARGSASTPGAFTQGQSNMGALPGLMIPPPPIGACCHITGTCSETTAAQCSGFYQGDATTCATVACPPPSACPPNRAMQTPVFTRYAENPIIRASQAGDPVYLTTDTGDTLHQCVARRDASSPWMMWYTGSPSVPPGGFAERRIHLATSNDGIHFTKVGAVLSKGSTGSFDDVQVHMPTVLWKDNQWKMWYAGHMQKNCGPCTPEQSAGWNTIGYATSPNGINWTKYGRVFDVNPDLNAFDSDTIREPTVLFDETDQLYKMWYDGTQYGGHFGPVGYATSPDGIHWTRVAQVSATEDRLRGGAIKIGDYIYMFYNTGPSLGYSVSIDGVNWIDYAGNPFMTPTIGTWENNYLQAPSLVYLNAENKLYMFYNAFDGISEKIGGGWMPFNSISLPITSVGDYDGDGDVDSTDFARLQACQGESLSVSIAADCKSLTLDCDLDVDAADISIFIGCMSGSDVPFNPSCAN